MTTEPVVPRFPARAPTVLLREILDVTGDFETHLGRELAVNATDLKAMEHLISSGPLSPTELARRLGVSTAAATSVVDRLVTASHVTRSQHPTDRRGIVVAAAPKSIARAMGTIMPMIMGIDNVLDDFGSDEQAVITEYLERVRDVYRAQLLPAS